MAKKQTKTPPVAAQKSTARAPQAAPPEADLAPGDYPTTMYRYAPVTSRTPNGYEARQFADAEAAFEGEKLGWVHSPDDVVEPKKGKASAKAE